MHILDLIVNKRNGISHTVEELEWLINAFTKEQVPDYQITAWLMAVYFKGMTENETAALTMAMAQSGEILDLSGISGIKVDKHSTGGVADTTTLVLAPLVAAAGVPVAKMSGRGLGFTGGTIDKLEAIPNFNVTMGRNSFIENIRRHGLAITAQSANIAPADGKLYSLRDVTGTVESIPLIASSIMSKKIAAGADKILLDVKVGSGAFMKNWEDALQLALIMVSIGHIVNRETVAVITNMEEPLGLAVGNSLEIQEAIDVLKGKGADELKHLCLTLGAHMLVLAGRVDEVKNGYRLLHELLHSGAALAKFAEFITAQGGEASIISNGQLLPQAKQTEEISLGAAGYIRKIESARIGHAAALLGAGRMYKNQPLDLSVGIVLHHRVGDYIDSDQAVATVHYNDEKKLLEAAEYLKSAFELSSEKPLKSPLVLGVVKYNGVDKYF